MPIPVPGRVAEALRRSTVQIRCESVSQSGNGQMGNGSGVIVAAEKVITNAHVVSAARFSIESWEGSVLPATLAKIDKTRDLALLTVPGLQSPSITLGDSDTLRAGTPVFAVGNPFGFVGAISSGVVYATGARGERGMFGLEWIRSDLRLAPGNSGGPLADFRGQVVGINTMIASGGVAFAVPSRAVQKFFARKQSHSNLGVVVRPVSPRRGRAGMLILELVPGGAADAASLVPGDLLFAANGQQLRTAEDLQDAIDGVSDFLLHFEFLRGGQPPIRRVAVKLVPKPLRSAA